MHDSQIRQVRLRLPSQSDQHPNSALDRMPRCRFLAPCVPVESSEGSSGGIVSNQMATIGGTPWKTAPFQGWYTGSTPVRAANHFFIGDNSSEHRGENKVS